MVAFALVILALAVFFGCVKIAQAIDKNGRRW